MAAHPRSLSQTLLRTYRRTHERLLTIAEELSPEQFAWSAGPSLHSVAWQLWHAARWDDVFASYFHKALAKEPRTQVWERESLADRWSLASGSLGRRDTGTEMSDETAEEMRFPNQKEVVGYARLRSSSYRMIHCWRSRRLIRMATPSSTTPSSTSNT
jgi:uncharacterized damage-inducible protein DinB